MDRRLSRAGSELFKAIGHIVTEKSKMLVPRIIEEEFLVDRDNTIVIDSRHRLIFERVCRLTPKLSLS